MNAMKIRQWVWVLILTVLMGCAAAPVLREDIVEHGFKLNKYEFDGKAGNERVEILDFLYGNPVGYAARNPEQYRQRGECAQSYSHGNLNMPRKDLKLLYVKWRDNLTGEVREVSLDLQKKLPKDFGDEHRTFVSFKKGQLYVYVITPERRPADEAPNGPRATAYLKTITIFPEP